jgi:K+-transporting ATPase ATPase A chain
MNERAWDQIAPCLGLLVASTLLLAVFLRQRRQAWLPLNPQRLANVRPAIAFNAAVSFVMCTD